MISEILGSMGLASLCMGSIGFALLFLLLMSIMVLFEESKSSSLLGTRKKQ